MQLFERQSGYALECAQILAYLRIDELIVQHGEQVFGDGDHARHNLSADSRHLRKRSECALRLRQLCRRRTDHANIIAKPAPFLGLAAFIGRWLLQNGNQPADLASQRLQALVEAARCPRLRHPDQRAGALGGAEPLSAPAS